VLAKPGVSYVGKSTNGVPASHLVRVYSIRLEGARQRPHAPTGVEPLLHALQSLSGNVKVTIESFDSGDKPLVAAFWAADRLLGCIVADDIDNNMPNRA